MKEKISRNKISRHYKSFFGLESMGLGENDNLMIDWGESLVNDFCNQEAEKRIKERMPSEPTPEAIAWLDKYLGKLLRKSHREYEDANRIMRRIFRLGWQHHEGLRSRLTSSEKPNNSQKTEGGEG